MNTKFIVVAEDKKNGYVIAMCNSQLEAESIAIRTVDHSNHSKCNKLVELSKSLNPIASYQIKGNFGFINKSVWNQGTEKCIVYVVALDPNSGAMQQFIRERENSSLLLSHDEFLNKIMNLKIKFYHYNYGAN